MTFAHVMHFI